MTNDPLRTARGFLNGIAIGSLLLLALFFIKPLTIAAGLVFVGAAFVRMVRG